MLKSHVKGEFQFQITKNHCDSCSSNKLSPKSLHYTYQKYISFIVLFPKCPPKYFSHPTKRICLLDNHSPAALESASFRVKELFVPSEFLISKLDFYCYRPEKPIITYDFLLF